jgi:hypothetical protein
MRERVQYDLRLLVNLLRHEMAEVALVYEQRRRGGFDHRTLDQVAAWVSDFDLPARQHRPVAVLKIGDRIGERRERDRIPSQDTFRHALQHQLEQYPAHNRTPRQPQIKRKFRRHARPEFFRRSKQRQPIPQTGLMIRSFGEPDRAKLRRAPLSGHYSAFFLMHTEASVYMPPWTAKADRAQRFELTRFQELLWKMIS